MDGFESRGNIKVLMATNRPDTLDPALMRPGRIDRKVEFGLPDLEGRATFSKFMPNTCLLKKESDTNYWLVCARTPQELKSGQSAQRQACLQFEPEEKPSLKKT